MKQKQLEEVILKTIENTGSIMLAKGKEYANSDVDRLANFKRNAENFGLQPLQVAGVFASKHWDSINNYIKTLAKGEVPKLSEPIQGRFYDLINYCNLMLALIEDGKENKDPKPMPMGEVYDLQRLIESLSTHAFATPGNRQLWDFHSQENFEAWKKNFGINSSRITPVDFGVAKGYYLISIHDLKDLWSERGLPRKTEPEAKA